MFHLIPARAHRAGLRLAHAVRKRWWRWRKAHVRGCRILAIDADDRVLLIRHSYGSGAWLPPGGGLKRGEDAIIGARRELREETGCRLIDAVEVAHFDEPLHGATNRLYVIAGWSEDAPRADQREVIEAAFFALEQLPASLPAGLRRDVPEWVRAAKAVRR